MTIMTMPYIHNIDPVAFEIFGFALHWYGLSYMAGLIFTYGVGQWLIKSGRAKNISPAHLEGFLAWAMVGVIIGGRLGEVLFYYPSYYLANPLEILKIWRGGMSFHGGLAGVIISLYIFTKRHNIGFFALADVIAVGTPFAIGVGRIANFINGELVGRPIKAAGEATDGLAQNWAVIFPAVDHLPRHPSQLYEAMLEGFIPLIILLVLALKRGLAREGLISGWFMILYGVGRSIGEIFREPEIIGLFGLPIGFDFTYGQLLSLPIIMIGIITLVRAPRL